MKLKAILLVVFVAGLAASLAFAGTPKSGKPGTPGSTTGSTTTTTSKKPKCQQVELKGDGATGSVSFTVVKANKRGRREGEGEGVQRRGRRADASRPARQPQAGEVVARSRAGV